MGRGIGIHLLMISLEGNKATYEGNNELVTVPDANDSGEKPIQPVAMPNKLHENKAKVAQRLGE